jgi:hypothetical protein
MSDDDANVELILPGLTTNDAIILDMIARRVRNARPQYGDWAHSYPESVEGILEEVFDGLAWCAQALIRLKEIQCELKSHHKTTEASSSPSSPNRATRSP